ncbi:MAG: M20/M25/M40 family metallo-hydrolase, partial [bacterium]
MSKTTLSWKGEMAWGEVLATRHDGMIELRRDLHRNPELSMAEHRTAEVIAERLHAAGLEVRTGSETTGAETAVVGVLRGERPGPTIGWRADIDALPLDEIPDLPFKSGVPGVMHACGHDGHTAIAVTLAEALAGRRAEMPGTAVFLFQPGEEVFGGAAP